MRNSKTISGFSLKVCVLLTLVFVFMFLSGCSTKHHSAHPGYSAISADAHISTLPLSYNLIIQHPKRLSKYLSIPKKVLHDSLKTHLQKTIEKSLASSLNNTVTTLPLSIYDSLARPEAMKIHQNTYVKTAWPKQGTVISHNALTPDYIYFIHECTIGFGLDGKELYDYHQSNRETINTSEQLSIVLSYSLWDNKKQNYVLYGYTTTLAESKNSGASLALLDKLLNQAIVTSLSAIPMSRGGSHVR